MWTVIVENFELEDKMVYHGTEEVMNGLFDAIEFATNIKGAINHGVVTLLNDRKLIVAKFIY